MYLKKLLFLFLISSAFYSCNKETGTNKNLPESRTQTDEVTASETDSVMTPEEIFSSSLVQDIMGEEEDIDLQIYLEEQIYPLVSKSDKITLDKISSSLYLVSYRENGIMRNFILQKFYNPVKDEFLFEKTDTQLNAVKQFLK